MTTAMRLRSVLVAVAVGSSGLVAAAAGPASAMTTTTTTFTMTDETCYAGSGGTTYPPANEATWSACGPSTADAGPGSGDMRASRSYSAGSSDPYTVSNVFARWDTSALPDDAQVVSATLEWPVVDARTVDDRLVTADWYLPGGGLCFGGCYTHADFSPLPQTSAQAGLPIDEFLPGETIYMNLDNVANVSRTDMTGLRLHVSGPAPTGENYVLFSANDLPRLTVTFQAPQVKTVDDTSGALFAAAWTASKQGPRGGAQVATYNLCGDRCHRNDTDPYFKPGDPNAQVVFMASAVPTTPWLIGLTEACRTNVYVITVRLADKGVFGNFFSSSGAPKTAPCMQYGFGNGLITIGGTIDRLAPRPLGSGHTLDCLYKQGFGFTWTACVAHLIASHPDLACQELAEAHAWRDYWDSLGQHVIVAGDLNLNPAQVAGGSPCTASQAWSTTEDVDYPDLAPTFELRTPTDSTAETKIDWIFARTSWFPSSSGATACAGDKSDHCYLYGAFSL